MKRLSAAILLALLCVFVKPALADDASQRAVASKLIDTINSKESIRAQFDSMMNNAIGNMAQHGMPPEGVDEIRQAVGKWYSTEINFEDIRPKMVDAYVKSFTEDELKQILAFYQSPIGAKAIKEMPSVMQAGALAAQEYTKGKIGTLNSALTPILMKYRDKMEPSTGGGAPSGPPPGP